MTFELRSERRNQGQMGPAREGKLRGRKRPRGVGGAARRPAWAGQTREEGGGKGTRSEGCQIRSHRPPGGLWFSSWEQQAAWEGYEQKSDESASALLEAPPALCRDPSISASALLLWFSQVQAEACLPPPPPQPPRDVHILIPGAPGQGSFRGDRDFADRVKRKILRWDNWPRWSKLA